MTMNTLSRLTLAALLLGSASLASAKQLGLGLAEIEAELSKLPQGRTPTVNDWQKISRSMRKSIKPFAVSTTR